jgi:hypothetical protein
MGRRTGSSLFLDSLRSIKKPLRKDCVNFDFKGLRRAVSLSRGFADPEMDQRVGVTIHGLLVHDENALFTEWRPSWVDGSDDDDGECRSEAYKGQWTSQERIPISDVLLI